MKKALSILIVACLLVNTAYAGEWVLKKKDEEKVKSLSSTFPSIMISGVPHIYLGNYAYAMTMTGIDVTYAYYVKECIEVNSYEYLILFSAFYIYLKKNNINKCKIFTDELNDSIEKKNINNIKKSYVNNGIGSAINFCVSGLLGLATKDFDSFAYDIYNIWTVTSLFSSVAYFIQAKRLDNAVFEEDIKQVLSSPLIVSPYIKRDHSGIMIARRF